MNPGGWADKTTTLGREGIFELIRRGLVALQCTKVNSYCHTLLIDWVVGYWLLLELID